MEKKRIKLEVEENRSYRLSVTLEVQEQTSDSEINDLLNDLNSMGRIDTSFTFREMIDYLKSNGIRVVSEESSSFPDHPVGHELEVLGYKIIEEEIKDD